MKNINLSDLKTLNALIEYKSAVKAAKALNTSSSSISYTLKKLRQLTGHLLFKRTRYAMVPDSYALALQKKYLEISALSERRKYFIITTYSPIELLLTLSINDITNNTLFLQFSNMSGSIEQRLKNIRDRAVDIDIGSRLPEDSSILCLPYFQSEMCMLVSENHSTIKTSFGEEDWYQNDHVIWLRGNDEISDDSAENNALQAALKKRNVACESFSLLSMAHICACSNNIMMIPDIFSGVLCNTYPLKKFNLPWDISVTFNCYIHCHRKINDDPNSPMLMKMFEGIFE